MRPIKFALLTVAVVLMLGVLQARADSDSDDLTVCCAQINPPDTTSTAAALRIFRPQVLGCKAIDGSPKSISACTGVVLGCSEGSFLCQPDTGSYPGLLDCLCNTRVLTPF
jgi:hypothetical protein